MKKLGDEQWSTNIIRPEKFFVEEKGKREISSASFWVCLKENLKIKKFHRDVNKYLSIFIRDDWSWSCDENENG